MPYNTGGNYPPPGPNEYQVLVVDVTGQVYQVNFGSALTPNLQQGVTHHLRHNADVSWQSAQSVLISFYEPCDPHAWIKWAIDYSFYHNGPPPPPSPPPKSRSYNFITEEWPWRIHFHEPFPRQGKSWLCELILKQSRARKVRFSGDSDILIWPRKPYVHSPYKDVFNTEPVTQRWSEVGNAVRDALLEYDRRFG